MRAVRCERDETIRAAGRVSFKRSPEASVSAPLLRPVTRAVDPMRPPRVIAGKLETVLVPGAKPTGSDVATARVL